MPIVANVTGVIKKRRVSGATRVAVAAAAVLGLGIAGVTAIGGGSAAAPVPAARSAFLDFGSHAARGTNPFGPAPVDQRTKHRADRPGTHKRVDKQRGGKPTAVKPGQRARLRKGGNTLPGVGRPCGRAQANDIRGTARGTMVCAQMGSGGHRWVKINGVDPQLRKPGAACTGQYTTARSPRGKAMQCARGRWTYGA